MYKIVSDVGADIPQEWIVGQFDKLNQPILINGENTVVAFNNESLFNFYKSLGNCQAKTMAMQKENILPQLQAVADNCNQDILFVGFSSRLSGTAGQIKACAEQLNGQLHTNIKFWDSLQASAGQALLVERALQNRRKGLSICQNVIDLENNAHKVVFEILVADVERFSKGGRAKQLLSTQLFPILGLERGCLYHTEGKFLSRDVAKAYWLQTIYNNADKSQKLLVCHGSNIMECQQFAKQLRMATGMVTGCCFANAVLGAHTGDNLIAIAYWKK